MIRNIFIVLVFITALFLTGYYDSKNASAQDFGAGSYQGRDRILIDPVQSPIENPEKIPWGIGELTPVATYDITARVLAKKTYTHDKESEVSPIDIALGWKDMSSFETIDALSISQSNRFYYYRWGNEGPPIPPQDIINSSANVHMIPANDDILNTLKQANVGQIIHVTGYLVNYYEEDDTGRWWGWNTSTTREDTGKGACEVLYVQNVKLF
jgi:hypothetical protein